MAVATGYSKIVTSGSVFLYDTGDTVNSYKGEPTTNKVLYSQQFPSWNNYGGTITANTVYAPDGTLTGNTFNGSPAGVYITVPSVTSGVTYTVSLYAKLGSATNVVIIINNTQAWNTIGGKSFTAADGLNTTTWTRLTYTFTGPAYGAINYHIGQHYESGVTQQSNGTYYVWGAQVEQNSHATPYIATTTTTSTRSNTQGLLDISGIGNTITLANMSYDSNAQMVFDGTSNYITSNNNIPHGTNEFSYFALVKLQGKPSLGTIFENGSWTSCLLIRYQTNGIAIYSMGSYWGFFSFDPPLNTWYYLGFVRRGNAIFFYVNGVNTASIGFTANIIPSPNLYIGMSQHASGQCFNGFINVASIYTRALSDGEILTNFNHYKTRFNIT
jgi:hypothetical protein